MEEQIPHKEPETSFRGLYKNVKISVRTLDIVIIAGILAIVLILVYGVSNNGYTVTFDSNGGTDVPSQERMYGELVAEPEPPTREGYTFGGWYQDEAFHYPWDMQTNLVSESTTLYARWIQNTE